MNKIYDTAIVGGGIAAYTAALTAKNLLLDYVWLGERGFGEKLRLAEKITNFPTQSENGAAFAASLAAQMQKEGLVLTERRVDGVYQTDGYYTLTAGNEQFFAQTVIVATGVESKGKIAGEREFLGRGVSYCAVCDGALYRGKKIAAILANEKFEEEAKYLAQFAEKVYCVYLYPAPRLHGGKFEILSGFPVAVEGDMRVRRLVFQDKTVEVDGVFFLKNSAPPEALVYGIQTDGGHVVTDKSTKTNLSGVFAAGDVTGRPYQYVKAAGEGCVAAHAAREYLRGRAKIS